MATSNIASLPVPVSNRRRPAETTRPAPPSKRTRHPTARRRRAGLARSEWPTHDPHGHLGDGCTRPLPDAANRTPARCRCTSHENTRNPSHTYLMGVGLTNREIEKVVNDYIGVTEGHFGDFSFSTHADFHPALRDLDVDLSFYGKTREQFVYLLASQPPEDQAKILQGLIELCPSEADNSPRKRAKTASEM